MKRLNLLLATAALGVAASAQSLDLQSFAKLRRYALEQRTAQSRSAEQEVHTQGAMITLAPGFTVSDLEAAGVEVKSCRAGIAVCIVETERAEEISSLPCVKAMSLQRPLTTNMDVARKDQQVDEIHTGDTSLGLTQNYTGKGVIAGIVDQGLDAHHINFRFPDGTPRISYLYWARINSAGTAVVEDHYNYTNLDGFSTDNRYTYHATHTLGILAGAYDGPVTVGTPIEETGYENYAPVEIERCPYYGMAPSADICVSCGDLQDALIAYGVESLLNYRYYMGWPMVLNMSLGSSQGAHDPNSQMALYLNEAGKEAIICMSAGNEGDLKIALQKTLTEEDTQVKTFIYPYYYQYDPDVEGTQFFRNGSVEIWSGDSTPFEVKAVIYNKSRGYRAAYNMPVQGENIGTYYTTDSNWQLTDDDVIGDPTFCKAYSSGYVGVGAKVDEQTGRYYGMVDYYVYDNMDTNIDDNYLLGFEVTGQPGQTIYLYCDGNTTWLDNYGVEGFDDGSTDGSISDLAMAENIVVVGSYNTRKSWLCLDGGESRYEGDGFEVNNISGFSSYGTTLDGRDLPLICAPGSAVVSSVSWPYARLLSDSEIVASCSAKLEEDGRTNYWKQEVGTSMSTPYVAGGIALWLEANPNLTISEVKDIIARTAIVDDAVKSGESKRWGAGKFNVLGGLKEAIRMQEAGIKDLGVDNDRLLLTPAGDNVYTLFLGTAASGLNVRVHALDGREVMSLSSPADELTVDLSALPKGVYVLTANGKHSQKIAVK